MSERALVSSCIKDRTVFEKVESLGLQRDMSEQARAVLAALSTYYDRDPAARAADPGIVARALAREHPRHADTFESLVSDLADLDVSARNVVQDVLAVKRESVGGRLASALAAGRQPDEVLPLMDEYHKWTDAEALEEGDKTEVLTGFSVAELVRTKYDNENIIRVWPKALNERLDGGVLRGHHIVVFAQPEVGKTLMLMNMAAGFLNQGLRVLYVGNEDPWEDMVIRIVSRLSGLTKYQVMEDPDMADDIARRRGYENFTLAELTPGTPREIGSLMEEYKPDVVFVDQVRNLNVGEDNRVNQLEKAAQAMRNLGKKYHAVMVSSTQAGDSASGKAVLEMGDVDFSNTGIPSTADVMIGIGGTREDFMSDRRVLSLCKNKRSGNHDFFPVMLDRNTNKVRSV